MGQETCQALKEAYIHAKNPASLGEVAGQGGFA